MNNLENLCPKDTINNEEYDKLCNKKIYKNRSNKKIDLDTALSEKLEEEFKELCQKILKKDKEKILDSAYEITVKEEIKNELKSMNLYNKEKEIMLLKSNLLNEFYHDWLDCDTPLGESLRDNLEESIATLTKYIINSDDKEER